MSATVQAPRVLGPTVLPRGLPAEWRRLEVAHWLGRIFTAQQDTPLTVVFDLDQGGYDPDAGELVELVRGIGNELRSRNLGRVLFVFATRDDSLREVLRSLAAAQEVPIYVASSASEIDLAQPAILITPAKRSALDAVAVTGRATASLVAQRTGGSAVAAGNALADLHAQGLLLRLEGAGRVGHTYQHPGFVETMASDSPMTTTIDLPDTLGFQIAEVAGRAGREPGELVAEAWRDFMERNHAAMAESYQEIGERYRTGDREGLIEAATRNAAARAPATRPARDPSDL
jgi:hypothetical protein